VDPWVVEDVKDALRAYPDFPVKGILFQDVAPLFADPLLLARVVGAMADPWAGRVDKVLGIESRGFLLGVPIALRVGAGFVPVRKMGKLPGETLRESYALEYGNATLEIQKDALRPGERVLVVDDVVATAGTAQATARLAEAAGAKVAGFAFLLEIAALKGLEKLGPTASAVLSI
jgi:adenine phosphoribosyltransferase